MTRPIGCGGRSSIHGGAPLARAIRRPARQSPDWRPCSARPVSEAASPVWHGDAEERPILLAAEYIGIAWAAARAGAPDREFDRQCGVELDVIADAAVRDAEEAAQRSARQYPALPHTLVIGALGKDDIEGDMVDPGILAADRLRNIGEPPAGHHTPASVTKVGKSSSGSSSRSVWLIVHR